jgi:hypothetical protein
MDLYIGQIVLVRDHRAGIHVGTLLSVDLTSKNCILQNARKIWYWEGAASCHGIAAKGLCHTGSKVAPCVPVVASCDVVEIVVCTPEGATSVLNAPEWAP